MPIAIISVYDKTHLGEVGAYLVKQGFVIYATSGTFKYLRNHNIEAYPVEKICKNPEGAENFFSSLSFNSLVGVLFPAKSPVKDDIVKIDLVIYNFVPSWSVINSEVDFNILNVDLGGPTMIRAAAINYRNTIPIISPKQYNLLKNIEEIDYNQRKKLAMEAFEYCAWYDMQLVEILKNR